MNEKEVLNEFRKYYKHLTDEECIKVLKEANELNYNYIDYFPLSNKIELYNKDSDLLDFNNINTKDLKSLKKILNKLKKENIIFHLSVLGDSEKEDEIYYMKSLINNKKK